MDQAVEIIPRRKTRLSGLVKGMTADDLAPFAAIRSNAIGLVVPQYSGFKIGRVKTDGKHRMWYMY